MKVNDDAQGAYGRRVTSITASDAKNTFGAVLDRAMTEGVVAITKHDQVRAVVLSVDEYERLLRRQFDPLTTLAGEFDALVGRMQSPKGRAAAQSLFKAGPEGLGAAAVKHAKKRG